MERRCGTLLFLLALLTIVFTSPQPILAALIADPDNVGATDVDPADPTTWTSSTDAYVGKTASGALLVDGGSEIASKYNHIGHESGSTGAVTVDGTDSTWTNSNRLCVGFYGNGTLEITNGAAVRVTSGYPEGCIGLASGSTGVVTVDGTGSAWTTFGSVCVGDSGNGTLKITNGGAVSNSDGYIGYESGSTGAVTVDGIGSTWTNSSYLHVGYQGSGTLEITWGGLARVAGTLTVDYDTDNDSFINMAAGGMLALLGDADDSLVDFLDLVSGSDAIRYWDDSISGWSDITGATYGDDYTLSYLTEGDLAGYTVLTVLTMTAPGDANWDGMVNELDAQALATHWGGTGGWSDGDFNHDGAINALDASILAANWGHGTETSATVPEPSVLLLILGSIGSLAVCRRRRPRIDGFPAAASKRQNVSLAGVS